MVLGSTEGQPPSVQARFEAWSSTVPDKPSDDLAPGTQNSILKQAGLK
jgi:predicted RNA binding protein YcfA (HicA-like mRNA interferase family)